MTSTTPTMATPSMSGDVAQSNEVAVLHHLLVRVTRSLRAGGPDNLSAGVASAMWSIINSGPLRLSALAELESVSLPAMSRIVGSLEQQGFVERTPDPDDGRARQLTATPAGVAIINNARSKKAQILADAVARLDPDTRQELQRGLQSLADALTADALAADNLTAGG